MPLDTRMIRTNRDVDLVVTLPVMLQDLGVKVPDEVIRGAHRAFNLAYFRRDPLVLRQGLLHLSDEALGERYRDVGVAVALESSGEPQNRTEYLMRGQLLEEVADRIYDEADAIIDVLRPTFDEAADVVHAAAQLGITPETTDTDIVKADNVVELRDAWTSLPAAVRKLENLSRARILLSEATGVPPRPRSSVVRSGPWAAAEMGPAEDGTIGGMFHPDAPVWRRDFEEPWQMWVRVCAGTPARLLSVDDAVAAVKEAQGL